MQLKNGKLAIALADYRKHTFRISISSNLIIIVSPEFLTPKQKMAHVSCSLNSNLSFLKKTNKLVLISFLTIMFSFTLI